MGPDDHVCLCFHVTKRKIVNHIRVHRVQRASQLSECFGAGTGCGWCRPFLKRLLEQSQQAESCEPELPAAEDYAKQRQDYRKAKGDLSSS